MRISLLQHISRGPINWVVATEHLPTNRILFMTFTWRMAINLNGLHLHFGRRALIDHDLKVVTARQSHNLHMLKRTFVCWLRRAVIPGAVLWTHTVTLTLFGKCVTLRLDSRIIIEWWNRVYYHSLLNESLYSFLLPLSLVHQLSSSDWILIDLGQLLIFSLLFFNESDYAFSALLKPLLFLFFLYLFLTCFLYLLLVCLRISSACLLWRISIGKFCRDRYLLLLQGSIDWCWTSRKIGW